jgi:DNA-directed RNA polymerase specialized sigma24 family protein
VTARPAAARLRVATVDGVPYLGRMTGSTDTDAPPLAATLNAHERHLWGVCYRMTGSAADADDLVQETFARALARPRADLAAPRAWLTQVAVNLARDVLRNRRKAAYVAAPGSPRRSRPATTAPPSLREASIATTCSRACPSRSCSRSRP